MKVRSLDGREWTVRRRWLPRHDGFASWWERRRAERRGARDDGSWWHALDIPVDLEGLALGAIAVAVLVAFVFLGIPLLLALLDVLVILLLAVVGVVTRVLFRRPWTVEAVSGQDRVERQVVGWRRAGEEVALLAHAVEHGQM